MAARIQLQPINPVIIEANLTKWQELALQVEKMWLHAKYYLCCLASCLDFFGNHKVFEGCRQLNRAYNFGRKEEIHKHVQKVKNDVLVQALGRQGLKAEEECFSSNPFGGGVCYGASLLFARNYLEMGLDEAAKDAAKGASYKAVHIQDCYHNIEGENPIFFKQLYSYFTTRQADKTDNDRLQSLFNLTNKYLESFKDKESFPSFIESNIPKDASEEARKFFGKVVSTARCIYHKKDAPSGMIHLEAAIDSAVCMVAGFKIEEVLHRNSLADKVIKSSTWKKGIYSIGIPVYSRGKMWVILSAATLVIGAGWMALNGNSITFWGTNLQHIGFATMGLSALLLTANFKYLREQDGRHAVTFIVEDDCCILHDPNHGTGTHRDRNHLLKNLFDYYVGDVEQHRITVQKLSSEI